MCRLRNREQYQDFLKALNLYASEIVSKSELQQMVHDILSRYPDLMVSPPCARHPDGPPKGCTAVLMHSNQLVTAHNGLHPLVSKSESSDTFMCPWNRPGRLQGCELSETTSLSVLSLLLLRRSDFRTSCRSVRSWSLTLIPRPSSRAACMRATCTSSRSDPGEAAATLPSCVRAVLILLCSFSCMRAQCQESLLMLQYAYLPF